MQYAAYIESVTGRYNFSVSRLWKILVGDKELNLIGYAWDFVD